MSKITAIYKRELKAYFSSPIGYIPIAMFLLLSGILFYQSIIATHSARMDYAFESMMVILIFIVPILTMRLIAEERKNGTDQLLLTTPVKLREIILGKYFASLTVYIVTLIITFTYPAILYHYTKISLAPVISGYIGLLLIGGMFIAIGLFASSLTENQIIAAIVGFAILFILWVVGTFTEAQGATTRKVLEALSMPFHFRDFEVGILDTGNIFYYLSGIFFFLFLSVRVIERRRWSQG